MVRGVWILGVVAACGGAPRPPEPIAPVTPVVAEPPRDDSALVTRPSQLPAESAPATAEEIRIVTSDVPPAPGAEPPTVIHETVPRPVKPCDGRLAVEKAKDQIAMGNNAAAIALLQPTYSCDPQPTTLRLLVMVACRARRYDLAKHYFPKLPASDQPRLAQLCMPPSFANAP